MFVSAAALWYFVKPLHVTAAAGPGPAAGPEYQYSRLCVSIGIKSQRMTV